MQIEFSIFDSDTNHYLRFGGKWISQELIYKNFSYYLVRELIVWDEVDPNDDYLFCVELWCIAPELLLNKEEVLKYAKEKRQWKNLLPLEKALLAYKFSQGQFGLMLTDCNDYEQTFKECLARANLFVANPEPALSQQLDKYGKTGWDVLADDRRFDELWINNLKAKYAS